MLDRPIEVRKIVLYIILPEKLLEKIIRCPDTLRALVQGGATEFSKYFPCAKAPRKLPSVHSSVWFPNTFGMCTDLSTADANALLQAIRDLARGPWPWGRLHSAFCVPSFSLQQPNRFFFKETQP